MGDKKIDKQGGRKPPLCIIGTAPSVVETPFGDETVEIWGVSTLANKWPGIERLDQVFELHPERWWKNPTVLDYLSELKIPIWMQDHYDEIPESRAYPRDEIKQKFHLDCMGKNLYVTNSITWMILKAIYDGYTDISLYGVHMAHETEYAYQRSSCSWALGIIHGYILQGLPYRLYIAEDSHIFKAEYEYGFDEPTKMMEYLQGRIQGLKGGVKGAEDEIAKMKERQLRTEGAISEAKHIYSKISGYN
jgi:hypothetical protein